MDYIIRKLKQEEVKVLDTFLYAAIFIPEGVEAPSKDIINQPELQVYVENFGNRTGDMCFVAEADESVVGVVWVRIMDDYGYVDNETPSFAISSTVTAGICSPSPTLEFLPPRMANSDIPM